MPLLDLLADTAEETNSMLQDTTIEISKSKKKKKDWGKKEQDQNSQELNNKAVTYDNWNPRRRREKGTEAIMTENFLQINVRYQTTDPGSSENTKPKQDKRQ